MAKKTSRRAVFKNLVLGGATVIAAPALAARGNQNIKTSMLKGNINHSVCRWTYSSVPLEELCKQLKNKFTYFRNTTVFQLFQKLLRSFSSD